MPKKKKTTKTVETSSTKVFDVARPGKVAANATSRPVIVGHKPQIKDPMMSSSLDGRRTLMDSRQKVALDPSKVTNKETNVLATLPASTESAEPAPVAPEPIAPSAAPVTPQSTEGPASPQPEPAELEPDKAAADISSMILGDSVQVEAPAMPTEKPAEIEVPTPVVSSPNPVAPQPSEPVAPANQATQANQLSGSTGIIYDESPMEQQPQMSENANNEPLPVLPEEKTPSPKVQVVVSHHKPRPGGAAVLGWIIFVLLLAAVVFDVLLDAGIVTLSVPHTHFF